MKKIRTTPLMIMLILSVLSIISAIYSGGVMRTSLQDYIWDCILWWLLIGWMIL